MTIQECYQSMGGGYEQAEILRRESETIPDAAQGSMEQVTRAYRSTMEAIRTYLKQRETL